MRQRRNKASTRASLRGSGRGRGPVRAPSLPIRGCHCGGPQPEPKRRKGTRRLRKVKACETCGGTGVLPWHHLTQAWWTRLWASEISPEFIEVDIDGLFELASLKDTFWWGGGTNGKLGGEIRLQEARFGLDVLARRRLDWRIEKPEDEDGDATPPTDAPRPTGTDARGILRMVP